eukprot:gene11823-11967_t
MKAVPTTQISEYAQRQLGQDVIDFAAGQPSARLLPLDLIAAAASHRLTGPDADPYLLQYGPERGYSSFRQALSDFLSKETNGDVDPAQLMITAGVSHGLDMCCRLLAQPGDVVLVEQPTYFLAGAILKQARLQPLFCCRPRLLYIIPVHNNPAGTTLPLAKRQKLLQLAHEYNFIILADEVYQLLTFPDSPPPPPPMRAVEAEMLQQRQHQRGAGESHLNNKAPGNAQCCSGGSLSSSGGGSSMSVSRDGSVCNSVDVAAGEGSSLQSWCSSQSCVVSLGSFSKILAPGLRLGWIHADSQHLNKLVKDGVLGSGGSIAPLASGVAHSCIQLGLLDAHLHKVVRPQLQANCLALCEALKEHLPGCRFHQPSGGYFVWLELPEQVCSQELLQLAAAKHSVRFCPGRVCDGYAHMLRLSFSFYTPAELQEGARRLGMAVKDYLETCEQRQP